jgi:hypothetical protein
VTLLGCLAVLEAEAGGDLQPGGSVFPCAGYEVMLVPVEITAKALDAGEGGQRFSRACRFRGCQRLVDIE